MRGSQVQIEGTTFTGATAVKFGTVVAPSFTVDDDSHITVTVPPTALTSKLSVTTPAGTGTSVPSYTVILPPTIADFTPAARPGRHRRHRQRHQPLDRDLGATLGGVPAPSPRLRDPAPDHVPAGAHTGPIRSRTRPAPSRSVATFKVTPNHLLHPAAGPARLLRS